MGGGNNFHIWEEGERTSIYGRRGGTRRKDVIKEGSVYCLCGLTRPHHLAGCST